MNNLYDLQLPVNLKITIFDQNKDLITGTIKDIENSFNWSFFDNSFFTKNNIKLFTDTFVSDDYLLDFKSLLTQSLIKYSFLDHSLLQELYTQSSNLDFKNKVELFMRLFVKEYQDLFYLYYPNEYFLIEKYNLNRNGNICNLHILKNSKYYSWSNVYHSRFEFVTVSKLFNDDFNSFLKDRIGVITNKECKELNSSLLYGINCLYYHINNYIDNNNFYKKDQFLTYLINQNLSIIRKKVV